MLKVISLSALGCLLPLWCVCVSVQPLIMMDLAAHDVESLIQKSGFPAKTLLVSRLCHVRHG